MESGIPPYSGRVGDGVGNPSQLRKTRGGSPDYGEVGADVGQYGCDVK